MRGKRFGLAGLALLAASLAVVAAAAAPERLDALFARLATAGVEQAPEIEAEIQEIWNDPGSDSLRLLFERGHRAMAAGRLDHAVDHLDDLVRLAPEFAEGWNARATAHYLAGEYSRSLDDIAATLQREPRHFGALSGRGLVYLAVGEYRLALDSFRRALRIHPHLDATRQRVRELEQRFGRTI